MSTGAVLNKEVFKMDIQGYIDDVNAFNNYIRLAIAFGLILFGILVAKYLVIRPWWRSVSYTHLTLPTILLV